MLAMYLKGVDQLHCYITVHLICNLLSIFKNRFSQDAAHIISDAMFDEACKIL